MAGWLEQLEHFRRRANRAAIPGCAAERGVRAQPVVLVRKIDERAFELLFAREKVVGRVARRPAAGEHVPRKLRTWKVRVERVRPDAAAAAVNANLVVPHQVVTENEPQPRCLLRTIGADHGAGVDDGVALDDEVLRPVQDLHEVSWPPHRSLSMS